MGGLNPSIDVFIGGLITAVVALIGVALERRHAASLRKKERLEKSVAVAYSVQVKIAAASAWIRSTKRAIDECFEETSGSSAEKLDPGVRVLPLVGVGGPDCLFSSEELALAMSSGDTGLVEKLLSFQWNFNTTVSLLHAFNDFRREYSQFIADASEGGKFDDGLNALAKLPSNKRHALDARIAQLNSVLGSLVESLDDTARQSKETLERFQTSISSLDGLNVEKVSNV